jgi:hypothetical protein
MFTREVEPAHAESAIVLDSTPPQLGKPPMKHVTLGWDVMESRATQENGKAQVVDLAPLMARSSSSVSGSIMISSQLVDQLRRRAERF